MEHQHHQREDSVRAAAAGKERQAAGDHLKGHDKHAGHSVAMFRDKLWLSLALTILVVLLGHDTTSRSGSGLEFVPAIIGAVIFFYGGMVFLRGAQGELTERKPG